MIWHSATQKQVIEELNSNQYKGLTTGEALMRARRGGHQTPSGGKGFLGAIVMRQLKSIPLLIITVSAIIWFAVDLIMHNDTWWSALVMLFICLMGVGIDITKVAVSHRAMTALRNRSQPLATVLRNGEETVLPAKSLVPGDILCLKQGDYIPADARILQSEQLRCDESTLSGEPVAVEKQADEGLSDIVPLSRRSNMVFAGCTVSHGTATVIVVAVNEDTESAKMALIQEDKLQAETPLQQQWKASARTLGTAALAVSALVFVLGVIFADGNFITRLGSSFITCAALAAAVIPESLATTIATVLAVGVGRMIHHKLLIRSMSGVETLGKISVICTDKTGTLTGNHMTMTRIFAGKEILSLENETHLPAELKNLLLMGAMCCDADVGIRNGKEIAMGDHTEAGIVSAAYRFSKIDKQTLNDMYPRLCEIPFDADRKLKTSVNMIDGKPVAIVKGAPDILISRCNQCDQKEAIEASRAMAKEALRVIGIAFKPLSEAPSNPTEEELEHDLIFGGLVGLEDPPIPEAVTALEQAKKAGIRVVMMTGDHVSTAVASARQMGIMTEESSVITNDELTSLSDEELDDLIDRFVVYVRLSAENKERVVASLQRKGCLVAVTGDRVEDAPVLRKADVGCAMGQNGTDVAKGAAHAVVLDNHFATILYGVSAGRGIYENIRKAIVLTVGFGIGLGVLMVLGLLIWGQMPLSAVQIMLLNLLISVASVLPLGLEPPANKDLLDRAPRTTDRVLDKKGNLMALIQGLLVAAAALVGFGVGQMHQNGSSVAFAVFVLAQLLCGFSARSPYLLINVKRRRFNLWLLLGGILVVGLITLLLNVPALGMLFGLSPVTGGQIWVLVIATVIPFIVLEALKLSPLHRSR